MQCRILLASSILLLVGAGCDLTSSRGRIIVPGDEQPQDDARTLNYPEIRRQSDRYLAAFLKGDKAVMEELLHEDYQIRCPLHPLSDTGKKETITYLTSPHRAVPALKQQRVKIRLFGNTAIESGLIWGEWKEPGSTHWWGKLPYTRVWVKEDNSWQLAHEQIQ